MYGATGVRLCVDRGRGLENKQNTTNKQRYDGLLFGMGAQGTYVADNELPCLLRWRKNFFCVHDMLPV